jgi:hypothetical protein
MATIEQLNEEIRTMQKENGDYKKQFTDLLNVGIEGMNTEQKRVADVKIEFFSERIRANDTLILEKEKLIAAKEIEKEKLIAAKEIEKEKLIAAKEIEKEKRITAKEIEKEKRITADKARGETSASPTTFCLLLLIKLSTISSCLNPFLSQSASGYPYIKCARSCLVCCYNIRRRLFQLEMVRQL